MTRVWGIRPPISATNTLVATRKRGPARSISDGGMGVCITDVGNYTLAATTASTTANITVRTLTVSATGTNKVYDRSEAPSVGLECSSRWPPYQSQRDSSATLATQKLGTGKTVGVSRVGAFGID